jgi:hypothetical protein
VRTFAGLVMLSKRGGRNNLVYELERKEVGGVGKVLQNGKRSMRKMLGSKGSLSWRKVGKIGLTHRWLMY